MGCIYGIQNEVDFKWYIGKCTGDPETRKRNHFRGRGSKELKKAIAEYGVKNFTFHILHDSVIPELLDSYEIETIAKYNSVFPNGYNQTFGGDGCNASDETARKIAKSVRQTFLESPEIWRKAQKNATEAAAKQTTGKPLSESHRKAISNANKGKKRSKPVHNKSAIWDNVEEIIRLYTIEKLSCSAIAVMYDLAKSSEGSVGDLLKSNGIKLSRNRKPTRCDIWNRQEEVIRLYTTDTKSTPEIAEIFSVCSHTVLKVLKANGIEIRPTRLPVWNHQDEVIRLYTIEMKIITAIADIFETCADTVKRILITNNVIVRKNEKENNPFYRKPAHNRSPYRTPAHQHFISFPADMPLSEKRKCLQIHFEGKIHKQTINKWVRKWQSEIYTE